jgi:PKD repeat protein
VNRLHKTSFFLILVLVLAVCIFGAPVAAADEPIIIDHTSTRLSDVPLGALQDAKSSLHIAYGHTSHGSQIITGMDGLITFAGAPYGGSTYRFTSGGTGGALDLRDTPFSDASDLGNPDYTAWATATRNYLNAHPDVNVVMWSWCGQADTTAANINTYLNLMNQLETDYPDVKFVYMTGHLVGTGENGNLNQRNEQIRAYARANNKILYDFADIESYDPDGFVNYMKLYASDNCDYTLNGASRNWATEWQADHTEGVDWYRCSPAHTQALNGNQKAYAAWYLFARLAGWDGTPVNPTPTPTTPTTVPTTAPTTTTTVPTTVPPTTTTVPTTVPTTIVTTVPTTTVTTVPTTTPVHTVPEVTAEVSGDTVIVRWQQIDDPDLIYNKIVVSHSNPDPAYPADGYMVYYSDRTVTSTTLDSAQHYNGGDFGGYLVPGETYYFSVTAVYQPYTPVAGNAVQLTFADGTIPTATPTPTPTQVPPVTLPDQNGIPADPDGDGVYEDLNANGRIDFDDVVTFFGNMDWIAANEPISLFDFNGNGRIDFADVVLLYDEV